jgi:hypothetical protein
VSLENEMWSEFSDDSSEAVPTEFHGKKPSGEVM